MTFILIVIIVVLSLFLYAHIWSAREGKNFDLVYAAAIRSHNTDEPVTISSGTTAAAERFFEVYGTTEKKFELIMSPVAYAGYVNLADEEVIVVAFRNNLGLTVTTHTPPYQFDNDFLSLTQKRQFMQDILQLYKSNFDGR